MNRFAYRIHYHNEPRRIGHIPMNSDEVFAALGRFRDALPGYLAALNATVEMPEPLLRHRNALRVVVSTDLDWAKASKAMTGFADRHGLHATHVTVALASTPSVAKPARISVGALLQPAQGISPENRTTPLV